MRGAHGLDRRAIGLFIGLDVLTYALVYWLVVPAFAQVLAALDGMTIVAAGHVITAVRLTFIGAVVTRSIRGRRGIADRAAVMPVIAAAALSSALVQLAGGIVAALVAGAPVATWAALLGAAEWVGFGLLGAVFVAPGEADVVPLRFRDAVGRESGSVTALLVPAVAGLLFVTVAAIVVIGSATNDRRTATTAADAAALAAGEQWKGSLRGVFAHHAGSDASETFWALAGIHLSDVTPTAAMAAGAADYAARNDADLIGFSVDVARGQVSVRVRANHVLPNSSRQVESTSTAAIEFAGGLCRSGDVLGYLYGGACHVVPPVTTPVPTAAPPTAEPTSSPAPPFERPAGLGRFAMSVAIVA